MRVFDKPGPENTDECVRLAYKKAGELGLTEVVVATNTGSTALKVLGAFRGFKVIAVNHHAGFREPWQIEMPEKTKLDLEKKGAKVVIASHALSGIERSFRGKFQGIYPTELVASVLKLFGQGTKVCVEIALMAADAGAISGKDVVCIAGTGTGADTALVLKPAHQRDFFDLRIQEIICKPRM